MSHEFNSAAVEPDVENVDSPPEVLKLKVNQKYHSASKTSGQKSCNAENKHSKTIELSFSDKDMARCAGTEKNNAGGGDQKIRTVRPRQQKSKVPGWLMSNLDPEYFMNMLSIKATLKAMKSHHGQMIEQLLVLMKTYLQIEVTFEEIQRVLMTIPWSFEEGPSFLQFMLYMANFVAAEKMYIKYAWKSSYKPLEGAAQKKSGKQGGVSKIIQNKKRLEGSNKTASTKKYSRREQILYSGILIFEMHSTLQDVENLHFRSLMPKAVATQQKLKKVESRDPDLIRIKKKCSAAWDKPPPPVLKISPYASAMPVLIPEEAVKPKKVHKNRKLGVLSHNQVKHLRIETPRDKDDATRIGENRKKIREAVTFLAASGHCVCLLPEVQDANSFSDSVVDKLGNWTFKLNSKLQRDEKELAKKLAKEIKTKPLILPESKTGDLAWINRKAKSLYQRHGLPKELATMKPLVKYTDGLNIRTLCEHIQNGHLSKLSSQKLEFRTSAWGKMHVEGIPTGGGLMDSFVYTFVTYFPDLSHLPIVHDKNSNPY